MGNESENPFEVNLTKKDRTLLRETFQASNFLTKIKVFQRLDEPKEVIGNIFVEIVNDIEPNLKKVGSDRETEGHRERDRETEILRDRGTVRQRDIYLSRSLELTELLERQCRRCPNLVVMWPE